MNTLEYKQYCYINHALWVYENICSKQKTSIIIVFQESEAVSDSLAISVAVWWQDGVSDVWLGYCGWCSGFAADN